MRCPPAWYRCRAGAPGRNALSGDKLETATFDLYPFEKNWFRVTVVDAAGNRAWSSPYWLD